MEGEVLFNIVFTELPFKGVSGDVAAFHRIYYYGLLVCVADRNKICLPNVGLTLVHRLRR